MKMTMWLAPLALATLLHAVPACCADSPVEANKQLVKDFLRDIRQAAATDDPARIRAVVEHYMTADYIQHDQDVAPGREGYLQSWLRRLKKAPRMRMPTPNDLYFVADGDLVVWMSQRPDSPRKTAVADPPRNRRFDFNMVRIVDGKLAEHWDSR